MDVGLGRVEDDVLSDQLPFVEVVLEASGGLAGSEAEDAKAFEVDFLTPSQSPDDGSYGGFDDVVSLPPAVVVWEA